MNNIKEMQVVELTEAESHAVQGGVWKWLKSLGKWIWDLFVPDEEQEF